MYFIFNLVKKKAQVLVITFYYLTHKVSFKKMFYFNCLAVIIVFELRYH